ncbi:uncharacterized protein LOC126745910 [Anthonomus grandis grandis]|uniref:uncharacterized protein LOC126745910 n=1 Tax=Anthonomus grandis grandis TaxID=2921223 RepID=UPI002165EDEF|nr:uncharacterized protein LOC126745910 [Anthonomus grandis grandis]
MISICFTFSLLIACYSASEVVPIQSSHVDVRRSGAEFSYNIQENHGVAAVADSVPVIQPIVKTMHVEDKIIEKPVEIIHHPEPVKEQTVESRASAKKPEHVSLMQPLLISPIDFYSYYLPYHGYSLSSVSSRASIISPHISSMPYPYTLVRHV